MSEGPPSAQAFRRSSVLFPVLFLIPPGNLFSTILKRRRDARVSRISCVVLYLQIGDPRGLGVPTLPLSGAKVPVTWLIGARFKNKNFFGCLTEKDSSAGHNYRKSNSLPVITAGLP